MRILIIFAILVRFASPQVPVIVPVLVNLMKDSVKWSSPKLKNSGNVYKDQFFVHKLKAPQQQDDTDADEADNSPQLEKDDSKTSTNFVMVPGTDGINHDLRLGEDGATTSTDNSDINMMIGQVNKWPNKYTLTVLV